MNLLERSIQRLSHKVSTQLIKGDVLRILDDQPLQLLQVEGLDAVREDVEHWQPYGLLARPLKGARAVVGAIGANVDHLVAWVADPRHRHEGALEPGEVGLATDEVVGLLIRRGGTVHLSSANAGDWVALSSKVDSELHHAVAAVRDAVRDAPVAPMDGGATFKMATLAMLEAFLAAWPATRDTAATKVRAD